MENQMENVVIASIGCNEFDNEKRKALIKKISEMPEVVSIDIGAISKVNRKEFLKSLDDAIDYVGEEKIKEEPVTKEKSIEDYFKEFNKYDASVPGEKWIETNEFQRVRCIDVNEKGQKIFEVLHGYGNNSGYFMSLHRIDFSETEYDEKTMRKEVRAYYKSFEHMVVSAGNIPYRVLSEILAEQGAGLIEKKSFDSVSRLALEVENHCIRTESMNKPERGLKPLEGNIRLFYKELDNGNINIYDSEKRFISNITHMQQERLEDMKKSNKSTTSNVYISNFLGQSLQERVHSISDASLKNLKDIYKSLRKLDNYDFLYQMTYSEILKFILLTHDDVNFINGNFFRLE